MHGELAWLLGQRLNTRRDRALVAIAGVIPDLDGLTLLAGEEAYGRWHHVLTHGWVAALVLCGALATAGRQRLAVFGLALGAFHLHLLCDLAGSGPGWPLTYGWPFTLAEVSWSGQWDLASWQNAVIGLAATVACLACSMPYGRTVVELFSLKLDAMVVQTLRARFARK